MTELLPCPFCGGKASVESSHDIDGHQFLSVKCNTCRAGTAEQWSDEPCPQTYAEIRDRWNHRHSGGDGEALRDLHDSIREVYAMVPALPIEEGTVSDATNALHAFCLLVGIHKVDVGTPRDEAARAGERGAT